MLLPERVLTATAPELVSSFEISSEERLILNSSIEPWLTFIVVVPTVSSEMSWPSSKMRAVRPFTPLKETEEYPPLVGSKPAPSCNCTPGSNCAKSRKLRPLMGRVSICCAVSTPPTVD